MYSASYIFGLNTYRTKRKKGPEEKRELNGNSSVDGGRSRQRITPNNPQIN